MHALVVSDPTETVFVNTSCGAVNQNGSAVKKVCSEIHSGGQETAMTVG